MEVLDLTKESKVVALTEVQKAKIIVEIDRLILEAKRLAKKAREDESVYFSTLETYGSELDGPPLSVKVDRETAQSLRNEACFLMNVDACADPTDWYNRVKSNHRILKQKIAELQKELAELEKELKNLESTIASFEKLQKLLAS